MLRSLVIFCERSFRSRGIELHISEARVAGDGVTRVAGQLVFSPVPENTIGPGPVAVLDDTSAQQMMDELWRCGVRPTEGRGSAGSLAATESHLADMRAIAFGALKAKGVEVQHG